MSENAPSENAPSESALEAALRARAPRGRAAQARRSWAIPQEPPNGGFGTAWGKLTTENAGLFGALGPVVIAHLANVSLRHRYLYYEVPGAGSTSVKLALRRLETDDEGLELDDPHEVHDRACSPLLSPVQVGSFARLVAAEGFFAFTFVRNPFSRLLAAYLSDAWDELRPPIPRRCGRAPASIGFDEFVDAVAATPAPLMSPWWMPQRMLLLEGRLRLDFIGRFERLAEDLTAAGERVAPRFERFVHRQDLAREIGAVRVGDRYDARLAEIVRRTYAEDFDTFGYGRDLPADELV